jgi:transcriptional regulator with XRE-family HTH domain
MRNLFVSELCILLHQLGITQQAIADHLHVARASVAGWAGGQRPIPKRHALVFLDFTRTAIDTAGATAWADNRDTGTSLLHEGNTAKRFEEQVKRQLQRWELELYKTTGSLDREYQQHAQTLLLYLHQPPNKLSREEREQVRTAGNGLLRTLRALAYLYNRPEETEGRFLAPPFKPTPLAYFDQLVAWWRALQQEDESEPNNRESGP